MSAAPDNSADTHHLVYVKRRVSRKPAKGDVEDWALEGLDQPRAHIFGHEFLAARLPKPDQTKQLRRHILWFVGALRDYQHQLPFALDARMSVLYIEEDLEKIEDGYVRRVAERRLKENKRLAERYNRKCTPVYAAISAPDDAQYFSFNNVEPLIASFLLGKSAYTSSDESVRQRLAKSLQSPRHIVDPRFVQALTEHAHLVSSRPQIFISYRWREATPFAMQLVQQIDPYYGCWWDRWSMSRAVAQGSSKVPSPPLKDALKHVISRCSIGIVVRTEGYGCSEWTKFEYDCLAEMQQSVGMRLIVLEQSKGLSAAVAAGQDAAAAEGLIHAVLHELSLGT
jgi:hypothetical protein